MLELTAGEAVTYFDSPLGFRHGPKSALDADTLVVVYVSTDPYTRRYDLDIIAEIRAQLGQDAVAVISSEPIPETHGPALILPGLDGFDDALVALPYLVFAQYLALFTALEHRKTPDNPFPSGEVNRVVQGVTIYPMAKSGA
jgi:tagatose-6-phosphate ketose/aldose isomerase